MADHLGPLGASFLYLEDSTTVMHVGSIFVLDPGPDGLDEERLTDLIRTRVDSLPRYRQKVRHLPGRLAAPVWVDAADFDLSYHLRRSALPRPGTPQQLEEFVARILSRPLDRAHPLWELYVVEGVQGGRVAVVAKIHQALVDGGDAVDLTQVLLDEDPSARPLPVPEPVPIREPTDLELVMGVAAQTVTSPGRWVGLVTGGMSDICAITDRVLGRTRSVAAAVARTATDPAPPSPLNARIGASRRVGLTTIQLDRFRRIRDQYHQVHGAREGSVTDVVLTVITGALRSWLQARGEPVHAAARVRALVPVATPEGAHGGRSTVRACFVDLPVGEANPMMRLEQVAFQMRRQIQDARTVGARDLAGLAGFAPTTLHHLGAHLGNAASRHIFNLIVTNVPGPQYPLWLAGAKVEVSYPIIPLAAGQGLSIGLTSYDGQVGIGLNGDRSTLSDVDRFPAYLLDALTELAEALVGEAVRREWSPRPRERRTTMTRVFVAVGQDGLLALSGNGRLDGASVRAAAVTEAVRAAFPEDDEEELEYDAMLVAAQLCEERWPQGRVVVAAVEIPDSQVRMVTPGEGIDGYEVHLDGEVTATHLIALHAAERDADPEDELLWYDATELTHLAAGEL
ncbi:wax ester/triacylglycerol synthase family O-acyltransferase [Austwickia sp. TVS 96-490-7B]|uniref:WS/DGAT/MGAT family O-acyltransferase n=1 Tax=Austwickia sp. TVS 96-490-7B TaxID=2830843 RepID=UPI001C5A4635|nr:wax ester/triacylglycerol synthase family O-acyltransferase [Austwickia sp. TVS 96-490-7B]